MPPTERTVGADSERPAAVASDPAEADPEVARRAIRAHGEAIRREELRKAFDRLEAHGTLTAEQRRTVARMATALVDAVLAAPAAALEDAPEHDRETARTAIELFDPDR